MTTRLATAQKPVLEFFVDEKDARAFVRVGPPDDTEDSELTADRQRAKRIFYRRVASFGYDPRDVWSNQVWAAVLSKSDLDRLKPYFSLHPISRRDWFAGE